MLKAALRAFLFAFLAYSAFSFGASLFWNLPFFQMRPPVFYLAFPSLLAVALAFLAMRGPKPLSTKAAFGHSVAVCIGFALPTPLFFFLIGYGRILLIPDLPATWGTEFLATMALGLMGVPIAFFTFLAVVIFGARKWRSRAG